MRILFVMPYPLSPLRIRSYGFVHHLAHQHDVSVLFLFSRKRDMPAIQVLRNEGITVMAIEDGYFWKIMRVLSAFFSLLPLQVAYDASPRLRVAIQRCLLHGRFDVMHVEFIRSLGSLPDHFPVPVIWDAVDCISRLYEYGAKYRATWLLRILGRIEAWRVSMYEQQQLSRFHTILVTAQRDRLALLEHARHNQGEHGQIFPQIFVLPHGIEPDRDQSYEGERQEETLIFSGKMSFHANIAGVHYLVDAVMPYIWLYRPHTRLIIAGSSPPRNISRLTRDTRIQVTGFVPDLRSIIRQSMVAVCPLPYAVGIQNKVIEAMASGTPVVASSHAVGGLEVIANQDVLVADEPALFARAVLRLLDDQILWRTISENGKKYVSRYHDWTSIIAELTRLYTAAVTKASKSYFQEDG